MVWPVPWGALLEHSLSLRRARPALRRLLRPVSLRLVVLVFLLVGLAGLLTRNRLVDSLVD